MSSYRCVVVVSRCSFCYLFISVVYAFIVCVQGRIGAYTIEVNGKQIEWFSFHFLLHGFLLHHHACVSDCLCVRLHYSIHGRPSASPADFTQSVDETDTHCNSAKNNRHIYFFRVCSPPPSLSSSHAHIRLDKMPGNYCELFIFYVLPMSSLAYRASLTYS